MFRAISSDSCVEVASIGCSLDFHEIKLPMKKKSFRAFASWSFESSLLPSCPDSVTDLPH
jgi:hypothetical protein